VPDVLDDVFVHPKSRLSSRKGRAAIAQVPIRSGKKY
jgi:hypothetical protein